jgi:protein TonB
MASGAVSWRDSALTSKLDPIWAPVTAAQADQSPARFAPGAAQPPILPIGALVLWVGCLLVGVLGLAAGYPQVHAQAQPPKLVPVEVRVVKVDLAAPTAQPASSEDPASSSAAEPAAMPGSAAMHEATVPPLPAVALPSPGIAFAVPVEGPVRIVAAQAAIPVARVSPATHSPTAGTGPSAAGYHTGGVMTPPAVPVPPPVTRLTIGQGEGDQPLPEYPRESILGRQEGTVLVRLGVGADGRVLWAQVIAPCPWPLLNQSAVRTVREAWQFHAGPPRVYEVPIQFQLHAHDSGGP